MELRRFNAAVSYHAQQSADGFHIAQPHRVWGEITLTSPEDVVAGFSHDSRRENHAFYHLLQWLEEEYPEGQLSDEEFAQFCQHWSLPRRWRAHFKARIRREVEAVHAKGAEILRTWQVSIARARVIERALG
jgi:hypothetical protein